MADPSAEQEAFYALRRDLPRSGLSPAAQLEYDRLRPGWERDAARNKRDADLAAQRKGHTVDRSGTIHTFRYRRGALLYIGIFTAGCAIALGVVLRASNAKGGWHIWPAALLAVAVSFLGGMVRDPYDVRGSEDQRPEDDYPPFLSHARNQRQ